MKESKYIVFEQLMRDAGIDFETEYMLKKIMPEPSKFKTRHRIDYVIFVDEISRLAIEIEGGIFTRGRHSRGVGYWNDILKYNSIIIAGLPLLRFPAILVKSNPVQVVELIEKYVNDGISTEYLYEFYKLHKK